MGTIHYIYDRDGHLIAEADGATGATLREYIWLPSNDNTSASGNDTLAEGMGLAANDNAAPDLPLALVDAVNTTPVTYQIHTDHLGRPIRMTDAAKVTVWQAAYKPWGEVQSITGTVSNTLRFPGQYFQIETNLAYNWHRHYDPVTGRYTQPDPLRFVDGPSMYQYAMASPFMWMDRDGLKYWSPGSFGSGVLTVTDGQHGGLIVDLPDEDGRYIPPGGRIPNGADVDFFCFKGEWWKIKGSFFFGGGGRVDVDFKKQSIRARGSTMTYPATEQPRGWNAIDKAKGWIFGSGQSPQQYANSIHGQCGCK